jgi:hypothetical protein
VPFWYRGGPKNTAEKLDMSRSVSRRRRECIQIGARRCQIIYFCLVYYFSDTRTPTPKIHERPIPLHVYTRSQRWWREILWSRPSKWIYHIEGGEASKVYYQCGVLESQEFLVLAVGVDDWLRLLYVHNSTTTPRLHWRLRFDLSLSLPPSSAYKKPQQRTACVFLPGVRRSCYIYRADSHTVGYFIFCVCWLFGVYL